MKVGVDVAICGSMEVVKAGVDVDVDVLLFSLQVSSTQPGVFRVICVFDNDTQFTEWP